MKLNIKSLLPLLMVFLTFTACNEYEDYDSGVNTVYPESVPFGYYEGTTANGTADYSLLLTENAEGDSIAYVIMYGKEGTNDAGKTRTVIATTDLQYDRSIGLLTATAEESFLGETTVAYIAYKSNGRDITMQLEYGTKKVSSSLKAAAIASQAIQGQWVAVKADGSEVLTVLFNDAAASETANTGTIVLGEGVEETMTYTTDGTTYTITSASGTVVTLSYNDKAQLVATVNGESYVMDRVVDNAEPETFIPVALGTYYHSLKVIYSGSVFEDVYETVLYQSDKEPSRYCIAPFVDNPNGMQFLLDDENNITFEDMQYTGYNHSSYGPMYVIDVASYTGGEFDNPNYYDPGLKVYNFALAYIVSAGYFGFVEEAFQVSEEIEADQVASVKLAPVKRHFSLPAPASLKTLDK